MKSSVGSEIFLNPKKVCLSLFSVAVGLTFLHMCFKFLDLSLGHDLVFGLAPIFSLSGEGQIPTMFSVILLLIGALLLALIAVASRKKLERPYTVHWAGLSFIFIFLAMDEALEIHEKWSQPIRDTLNTTGYFYYAWVIPYAIMVLVFGLLYLDFVLHLPMKTRLQVVAAGLIYVSATLGLESLEGRHAELFGKHNWTFVTLTTIEEFMEMSGVILFIYALMSYLRDGFSDFKIRFGDRLERAEVN